MDGSEIYSQSLSKVKCIDFMCLIYIFQPEIMLNTEEVMTWYVLCDKHKRKQAKTTYIDSEKKQNEIYGLHPQPDDEIEEVNAPCREQQFCFISSTPRNRRADLDSRRRMVAYQLIEVGRFI